MQYVLHTLHSSIWIRLHASSHRPAWPACTSPGAHTVHLQSLSQQLPAHCRFLQDRFISKVSLALLVYWACWNSHTGTRCERLALISRLPVNHLHLQHYYRIPKVSWTHGSDAELTLAVGLYFEFKFNPCWVILACSVAQPAQLFQHQPMPLLHPLCANIPRHWSHM